MAKQKNLGGGVYLLSANNVSIDKIVNFFVIAHGDQLKHTTKVPLTGFDLYFPWGLGNHGWYDAGEGLPLFEIYRNYVSRIKQGLTQPTFLEGSRPMPSSLTNTLKTPLLEQTYDLPEIELDPKDLNIEFCTKMLNSYYNHPDYPKSPEDIGIVCLGGKSIFSKVLTLFSSALKNSYSQYSNAVVICLFCSVTEGEEQHALNRAEGYVQF